MSAATIVWFRRDLRVADHPALRFAVERGPVVACFVLDPVLLARRHHAAPARLAFLRAGLEALDAELRDRGSSLVIRTGAPAEVLAGLAGEAGADLVACTREISPYGTARDAAVAAALARSGVELREFGGDLVVEPEAVTGTSGNGYSVFTPFYRAWSAQPLPAHVPAPSAVAGPALPSDPIDLPGGEPPLPAGPAAARRALVAFVKGGVDAYGDRRDLLARDGTSRLSAYLRFGMATGAQIGRALGLPGPVTGGREAYWRQIAWREFYHHHLVRHPEVARAAYRPEFRRIHWDDDPGALDAWKAGRTGYPLVDAGMRQLTAEGWMHNRARMVAASFLIKDLLLDWRLGETHFMQQLVDGDPANNNGGWQWTAGTGTDAAPYFRVFNPVLQAKRFDPDGAYVRRYVPELSGVPDEWIHEPWRMPEETQETCACRIGRDYPARIVDHAERRDEVVARYRAAGEGA